MIKMTPRQMKIIERLGATIHAELGDAVPLMAAKGIVQLGLDAVCRDLGIELAAVQDYDKPAKLDFNRRLSEKIGERLKRLYIPDARIAEMKALLHQTYQQVM